MRLFPSAEFRAYWDVLNNEKDQRAVEFEQLLVLMAHLRHLPTKPIADTGVLKRLAGAKRHELWRVSHGPHPDVSVRIVCWFDDEDNEAVVTLVAGDKFGISDVWYDSAIVRGEAAVDQRMRERKAQKNDH